MVFGLGQETPFSPEIEAWANGPVVRKVFKSYQGKYKIDAALEGDGLSLGSDERDTVDAVLRFYGDKDGFYLSELTQNERPWQDARKGVAPGEKSNHVITKAAMRDYYGSLV